VEVTEILFAQTRHPGSSVSMESVIVFSRQRADWLAAIVQLLNINFLLVFPRIVLLAAALFLEQKANHLNPGLSASLTFLVRI
jgi:hypothetical protein